MADCPIIKGKRSPAAWGHCFDAETLCCVHHDPDQPYARAHACGRSWAEQQDDPQPCPWPKEWHWQGKKKKEPV